MKANVLTTTLASCFILSASSALAHVPFVEGLDFKDVYDVKAPLEKSLAIYMSFDKAGDLDRIRFTVTEEDLRAEQKNIVKDANGKLGRKVTFNTIVPRCTQYASILPKVALVGPAQEVLASSFSADGLPFAVEGNDGIFQLENTAQGEEFEERVAGTFYWRQKEASLIVTEPGTYNVYVWNPAETTGDYVLVFGEQEIYGPAEIVQSLRRIPYLRSGMEIKDATCRAAAKSKDKTASKTE